MISDIGFLKGVTRISETQANDNAVRFCEACSLIVKNGTVYGASNNLSQTWTPKWIKHKTCHISIEG